jgi:hypothetical protein
MHCHTYCSLVTRIHWLRARAQKDRWHEEVVLVTYEMQWTVRFFLHRTTKWEEAACTVAVSPGAKAYALRQAKMWKTLAESADKVFESTTCDYISPFGDII